MLQSCEFRCLLVPIWELCLITLPATEPGIGIIGSGMHVHYKQTLHLRSSQWITTEKTSSVKFAK